MEGKEKHFNKKKKKTKQKRKIVSVVAKESSIFTASSLFVQQIVYLSVHRGYLLLFCCMPNALSASSPPSRLCWLTLLFLFGSLFSLFICFVLTAQTRPACTTHKSHFRVFAPSVLSIRLRCFLFWPCLSRSCLHLSVLKTGNKAKSTVGTTSRYITLMGNQYQ